MKITGGWVLFFVSFFSFSLFSCQKEISGETGTAGGTGGTTNSIIGDWNFAGLTAHTAATLTVNDVTGVYKTVTTSDYTSKNNTGTVKITASQIIQSGVGYSIDTIMNVKSYIDNSLVSDDDFPFVKTLSGISNTSVYEKNSADSITVTGQLGVATAAGTPTGPTGLKISFSGDTLIMKMNSSFTQAVSQSGVSGNLVGSIGGIIKLTKK